MTEKRARESKDQSQHSDALIIKVKKSPSERWVKPTYPHGDL